MSLKTPEQEVTELESLFGEQMKEFAPVVEEGQVPYQTKLSADKTARNMGMDDKGFFPKGDPASIKKQWLLMDMVLKLLPMGIII